MKTLPVTNVECFGLMLTFDERLQSFLWIRLLVRGLLQMSTNSTTNSELTENQRFSCNSTCNSIPRCSQSLPIRWKNSLSLCSSGLFCKGVSVRPLCVKYNYSMVLHFSLHALRVNDMFWWEWPIKEIYKKEAVGSKKYKAFESEERAVADNNDWKHFHIICLSH